MIIALKPTLKSFNLKSHPEVEVTVRQASENENISRNDMFAKSTRIFDDNELGEIRVQQEYNRRKLWRREAYLTLASISGINDPDGNPLFRTKDGKDGERISRAMTETEFNEMWGALPSSVVDEIVEQCVHEVNVTWAAKGE
jgi:hypothetical protein